MGIRAILNGIAQPLTPNAKDADIRRTTPAGQNGQPTAVQADAAIQHMTRQFIASQNNVAQTRTDEQSLSFRTSGGSWRTPNDNPQHVRFYRDGEDTSNTTRFDREYYLTHGNQYVRLNARGALADLPENKNKPQREEISDFDWRGWEPVDVSRVPGEYTTEGKTISFKDTNNAQNQDTVLRRYIQQNVIGTDKWMGDVDTDEQAVARARALNVKVEIEQAGKNENGETLYKVKISDEDLAKLRGVKAEWQAERTRIAAGVERGRQETNQMFADQGRVVWNSAVNIVEGTINTGIDALRSQGGLRPVIPPPYDPLHVDLSGAKSSYQSEMMRRDHRGVVDGDGIQAGQVIETGVTIGAPLVVGAAVAPKASPQALNLPRTTVATEAASIANATKATADIRKFSEYIFTPNSRGKDVVFRNLGYSEKDSAMLAETWRKQAAEKFARGKYTLGRKDQFGQRVNIEIRLEGVGDTQGKVRHLKSGWMINNDGSLKLNTPFSEFTR